EQLFASRMIFFHGDSVNWECHYASSHKAQDVSDPSCYGLCRDSKRTETAFIDSIAWLDFHGYARLVALYNQHDPKYSEDALDAFQSVLSRLSYAFEGGFISGLSTLFFDAALLWQPYYRVSRRKASKDPSEAVLPSWSWVGWQGNINSESWRSACDYLRQININGIPRQKPLPYLPKSAPCSWHATPTVKWYHSMTAAGERTPISSA
ncbi:hypothetical protein K458DRAFT_313182, partial [Lentithecium fluviatile CBS 122367]